MRKPDWVRKPDLTGTANEIVKLWVQDGSRACQAWNCEIPETKKNGDAHSALRQWVVKGPFHPFWNTWIVTVLHLRDLPGLQPSTKTSPEMTHEFIMFALNPGKDQFSPTVYDPDDLPFPLPYLQPIDVTCQVECKSDAHAVDLCDLAVKIIMDGHATPDQDFRPFWERTLPATAKCDKHSEQGLQ